MAYYNGGIEGMPHVFDLDDHHRFEKDKPLLVCSNTASMLMETRFKPFFRVEGDTKTHYGLFDCGPEGSISVKNEDSSPGACC